MKTKVAIVLWVLGVVVAMLGSTAIDVWNKRQEQSKQINSILDEILANTCPNPACGPSCCGDKCECGPDCDCNLVEEVEEQLRPRDEIAPVAKPRLTMHTVPGCPPCEADKRIICQWTETWAVEILDDTEMPKEFSIGRRYPWYEVEELDGTRFEFTGQLSQQAIERGRNAIRASGR